MPCTYVVLEERPTEHITDSRFDTFCSDLHSGRTHVFVHLLLAVVSSSISVLYMFQSHP